MIIYQITNIVNNKFYIGKTSKTVEERLQRHFYNADCNHQTYLYKAIRKYGKESFIISIIEETENLNEREIYWVQTLNPQYNMTLGGDGGDTSSSPNFKKSMKEYHSKLTPKDYATYGMLGKTLSNEAKQKISKANSYPIMCDGVEYSSINEAQLAYSGISVRKRLESPKYPNFYRLRPKRLYNIKNIF